MTGGSIEFSGINLNRTNSDTEGSSTSEAPTLKNLTKEYHDVFEEPTGLPPIKECDHKISLKEGTNPINVKPYQYAQIQKDDIERLVNEMLHLGIIQPSNSPFSSQVLLVKKKDDGWRFCVDYRVLNRATIFDKCPIRGTLRGTPRIDDLLEDRFEIRIPPDMNGRRRHNKNDFPNT